MDKGKTITEPRRTLDIETDRWISFLGEFTRENRGAHARLEVIGPNTDIGYQVETEDRPFDGISADVKKKGETAVLITFESTPENHITHGVQNVTAIRLLSPAAGKGAVLEIEARDGTKTVLELSLPGEFELQGGEREARRS